ncbi:Hypothetical predicted protein [Marmota monax]|uniref:Heat shock factor-binding protein 1 n=1 Tax=Marmota monax TaxID=9995 RepID=A0A5E4A2C8_MARMO|nr:hypothetical protein GHT09_007543 [Marmota monax]VTJ51278.1 Hypothetical predicted protein [Marmota monax]
MAETDPKTVQDLTSVVQTLLQQMQDKFQTMSDQIIGRNIFFSSVGILLGTLGAYPPEVVANYPEIWNTIFPSQEKTEWLFATNYY